MIFIWENNKKLINPKWRILRHKNTLNSIFERFSMKSSQFFFGQILRHFIFSIYIYNRHGKETLFLHQSKKSVDRPNKKTKKKKMA